MMSKNLQLATMMSKQTKNQPLVRLVKNLVNDINAQIPTSIISLPSYSRDPIIPCTQLPFFPDPFH